MIKNVSTRNPDVEKEIEDLVGKSFPLFQRLKMKGNGSPRLPILMASASISKLLEKDTNLNYCNIELRPGGVIIGFRSRLETWWWCIPYYKLSLFQNKDSYSLYSEIEKLVVEKKSKGVVSFFRKLLHYKSAYSKNEEFIHY